MDQAINQAERRNENPDSEGANRRRHERSKSNHAAVVLYQGKTLPKCRILNFSAGGLFLQCTDCDFTGLVATEASGSNDKALVEVPLQGNQQEPILTVAVKIARVTPSHLGVAFLKPERELLSYLQKTRPGEGRGKTGTKPKIAIAANGKPLQSRSILKQIRINSRRFLNNALSSFFERAKDDLLGASSNAGSDAEQSALYFGQTVLTEQRNTITEDLLTQLETSFSLLEGVDKSATPTPDTQQQAQEMELIDTQDFDEWLVVVDIARAMDSILSTPLQRLENALTYLAKKPVNRESNPVSPYSFLWSLRGSLQSLELEGVTKKVIYNSFQGTVLATAHSLYQELGTFLAKQGIEAEGDGEGQGKPPTAAPSASQSRPSRSRQKRSVVETLASLFSFGQFGTAQESEKTTNIPVAPRESVVGCLQQIPYLGDQSAISLVEGLLSRRVGAGGARRIDQETRDTITATEQLIASLRQDPQLSGNIQNLLNRLGGSLIKETVDDPSLLNNPEHPVRKLLGNLDQLAPYTQGDDPHSNKDPSFYEALEKISQNALAGGKAPDISEVNRQIEELLNQRKQRFDQNLSVVIDSSLQNDALLQARESIRQLLTQKLKNNSVSIALHKLLQLGWPTLLVQVSAAGEDNRLKAYVSVIDFLQRAFAAEQQPKAVLPSKVEKLIRILQRGFAQYPVQPEENAAVTDEIQQALLHGAEAYQDLIEERVEVDEAYLQRLFQEQIPTVGETPEQGSADPSWLERVKDINVGDWIVEKRQMGQVRLLHLAWKNPPSTQYVFVDGDGQKALETEINPLARLFESGEYSLLENRELPLVERAVQRVMETGFSQVKAESGTDELTGLLNRKAFEREIAALTKHSKEKSSHILILLDIDRFKMINDVCGFEGGDLLLQNITNILNSYASAEAKLARTGDDEFGILVANSSINQGYQIAETERRALENLQFNWQGMSIEVSVSVGILAIEPLGGKPAELLRAVSSACNLAKEAGRNCSRVYQSSGQEFERRQRLIKSVPIIEQALENNRILLFGQLISPLFVGEEDDHYEILLRPLGEDGQTGNPEEFILAAERYDRMRAVDRWVINTFFSWAKQNSDRLDDIGGFTINVSGQSMNDEGFRSFLKQHLTDTPFPANKIGFEITETSMVTNMTRANLLIEDIRQRGCKFYLDDFGSGYASYSYLKDLPVDVIKIDGIFVKDILEEKSSYAMVKSITEIAHYMDKKVIAEYVENEAIIVALRELNVDFAQGYGVGKPLPLQKILESGSTYG